jgi:hypothetical protein
VCSGVRLVFLVGGHVFFPSAFLLQILLILPHLAIAPLNWRFSSHGLAIQTSYERKKFIKILFLISWVPCLNQCVERDTW